MRNAALTSGPPDGEVQRGLRGLDGFALIDASTIAAARRAEQIELFVELRDETARLTHTLLSAGTAGKGETQQPAASKREILGTKP